jgi:hypothetical protein
MIALRRIAIIVAAAACVAGLSSEVAALSLSPQERFNRCTDKCNDLEHNCRFGGTRQDVCFQGLRRCEDSCIRTGRPSH